MTEAGNCDVKIDGDRNLARVHFNGAFDGATMAAARAKVVLTLPQLRPGFTVFADFSGVLSMDLDCVRPLTEIMESVRGAQIGMLVRILPQPDRDIGINLLGLVHYRGRVKTVTVETVAEAERVLA